MRISVITPSFNQGVYIKDCIDSVRNQIYRPIEHIIIDNCSTDDTHDILGEYERDSNGIEVKIVIEPDKGQTDALNKGFRVASGELIAWLNADDFFFRNAFQKVVSLYFKNAWADVIYGDYFFVDKNGYVIEQRREIDYDPGILFYVGCYIPSSGSFFHKRIRNEGYFLNPDFDITMDYEFFVRLSKAKKKFVHIPEYLSCFRWHGQNKSLNKENRRQERIAVQQMYGIQIFHNMNLNQLYYDLMLYPFLLKRVLKKMKHRMYF